MDYVLKYLKYKLKYLKIKEQIGGANNTNLIIINKWPIINQLNIYNFWKDINNNKQFNIIYNDIIYYNQEINSIYLSYNANNEIYKILYMHINSIDESQEIPSHNSKPIINYNNQIIYKQFLSYIAKEEKINEDDIWKLTRATLEIFKQIIE